MTPQNALRVLDIVTNPANAGKLSRADYGNAELALATLAEIVKEHESKQAEAPKKAPAKT